MNFLHIIGVFGDTIDHITEHVLFVTSWARPSVHYNTTEANKQIYIFFDITFLEKELEVADPNASTPSRDAGAIAGQGGPTGTEGH